MKVENQVAPGPEQIQEYGSVVLRSALGATGLLLSTVLALWFTRRLRKADNPRM